MSGLAPVFSLIGIEYYKLRLKWFDWKTNQCHVLAPMQCKRILLRARLERKLRSCQQTVKQLSAS